MWLSFRRAKLGYPDAGGPKSARGSRERRAALDAPASSRSHRRYESEEEVSDTRRSYTLTLPGKDCSERLSGGLGFGLGLGYGYGYGFGLCPLHCPRGRCAVVQSLKLGWLMLPTPRYIQIINRIL